MPGSGLTGTPDLIDLIRYREEYFGKDYRFDDRLHVGVVTDINDPLKAARVRVRVLGLHPEVNSDGSAVDPSAYPWARRAGNDSTDQAGEFYLPQVGDFVIVAFLEGNIKLPIWFGGLWQSAQAVGQAKLVPDEFRDEQYEEARTAPIIRGFRTRAGHLFIVRDGDDRKEMVIKTASGSRLVLRDDDASGGGSGEDKGISLVVNDSKKIVISEESDTILIKVNGDCNVEASGNVNLGSGTLLFPDGIVTGRNIDPFTGAPFPDHSASVRAKQ